MRKLAVLDIETDPFEYNKVPQPFVVELWDGETSTVFWGKDCIRQMAEHIRTLKTPLIIYAHNGGKFDYIYFLEYLESELRIVNGRIIQAHIHIHELRDSYAIMPFPLRDFDKDEIDYEKMRPVARDVHKAEILKYLHKDCTSLYELVVNFVAEFGDKLTIGGSSLKQLKSFHKFSSGGPEYDEKFRKPFYYGGRVQVFRAGVIEQPIKIFDVNSQYPFSMKAFLHPVSVGYGVSKYIEKNTNFVVVEGRNYGAFPVRTKDGGLDFNVPTGRFCTSIHEYRAAVETRCFVPTRLIKTYHFERSATFEEFVDHFYHARLHAKAIGDKIHTLFYKFVLNSSYGKFAQNPENYSEWCITKCDGTLSSWMPKPWEPSYIYQEKYILWEKPLDRLHYYNVATGASITGAARSLMIRGIHGAIDPLYCDTDSLICRDLRNVPIDADQLGAWKCEGTGTLAAIAGKKLYAIFAPGPAENEKQEEIKYKGNLFHCIKKAHKGARLTGSEILRIAQGEVISVQNPVPAFGFEGKPKFTTRRIRRTV